MNNKILCKNCINCNLRKRWNAFTISSGYAWCLISPLEEKHSDVSNIDGQMSLNMDYDELYVTISHFLKNAEYYKRCDVVNKNGDCKKFKHA